MKDEKILENEILSDEELDQVSGGGSNQTTGDSDFLNQLGYTHDTYYLEIDDDVSSILSEYKFCRQRYRNVVIYS